MCNSSITESPGSSVPTIPDDSGVEVGQESEQEVLSQKGGSGNIKSCNHEHDTIADGLYFFTSGKLLPKGNKEARSVFKR